VRRERILRRPSLVASFCSQLPAGFRFNKDVSSASDQPIRPHWLRVVFIGRRPKATLTRIAALVVVCFVTFKFILLPIQIKGISMEPTLHDRQVHLMNRWAYQFHEPRRGDIVSIRFSNPGAFSAPSEMYMKRIIGLPGEMVSFHDGHAYINDRPLAEPYLKFPCDWEHAPIQCGTNQYYVVGDNRSMPFEYHQQGRATRERIVGKLFL
jgi:signal peptidase I